MIKKQSFPLDPHALPDTGISPQVERQIGRACSCMQPGQVSRSLNRFLYTQFKKAAYDMRPSNIQYWGLGHYNVPRVQSIVALVGRGWFLVLVIERCLRRRSELCGGFRGLLLQELVPDVRVSRASHVHLTLRQAVGHG